MSSWWWLLCLRRHGHAPTLLLIASKESTVQRADRVLLLDNGRIVDEGTHAQLVRQGEPDRPGARVPGQRPGKRGEREDHVARRAPVTSPGRADDEPPAEYQVPVSRKA